jgi:hypothetical protein
MLRGWVMDVGFGLYFGSLTKRRKAMIRTWTNEIGVLGLWNGVLIEAATNSKD